MGSYELVPLFAIFFIFGAPMVAWMVSRVLAHQERMEMIRNGFVPPPGGIPSMRDAMKAGWRPGGVPPPGSMGPAGGYPPPYGYAAGPYDPSFFAQQQLFKGIRLTLIGFALLIGISLFSHGDVFGPWVLGGLIPMFVGIAQIITALIGGARIGMLGVGGPPGGANFGPSDRPAGTFTGASTPGQGTSAPFGWRPGPTPEIDKPAGPPDLR